MAAFSSSAFNTSSFSTSAFSFDTQEPSEENSGGFSSYYAARKTVKRFERVADRIDEIIAEFQDKPKEELVQEVKKLTRDIPDIPVPDFQLTLEQLLEIKQIILLEMRRLHLLAEDEEVLLLYAASI